MDYIKELCDYIPCNEQESNDRNVITRFVNTFSDHALDRENEIAHITSSGFIMNEALDKVLLIHHNIRGVWAWTGGHADGERDLLRVAQKEAREETGIVNVTPLYEGIASIDILPVFGHVKKNKYVSAHLHLSIAYLLICDDTEALRIKPDENTAVAWFGVDYFTAAYFEPSDVYLYNKLIRKAKQYRTGQPGNR